jgi:hypothetical protein
MASGKSLARILWPLIVAAFSLIVSNFTYASNISNYGEVVDALSIGVDCSGTNDSAPALNAFSGTGGLTAVKLVFPAGSPTVPCLVKLGTTWKIYNSTSFTIDGGARCGLPGNCTHFKWAGATGGTVIDMEGVFGFEVRNVLIDGSGTAATGLVVDQNQTSQVATYDGIFSGMLFNANSGSSSGPNDGWVGLSVSPTSTVNVADIRVIDSAFECVSTGKATGTIGYGLGLANGSQNALLEVIRHNYFEHCGYGIYQKNGVAIIEENTFGGDANTIDDIYVGGIAGAQERIVANWSETQLGPSNQFLKAAFTNVTGPGIEISGNQIPINNGCALDVGGNAITSREQNVWYHGQQYGNLGSKACATTNGSAFTWFGPSGLSWPQDVTGTLVAGIFLAGSLQNGPSAGVTATSSGMIAQGVPVKLTNGTTVSGTTPQDTGAGIVIGVTANAPGTSARPTYVMTSGNTMMNADGECSPHQFVVVSSQTAGNIECQSAFAAGRVIGVATSTNQGSTVEVQIGLR